MANLKNAIKQIRKDEKRTERNLKQKADLKTLIKKTRKAIEGKEKNVDELLSKVQKSVDKAVQKKVIKKNTGARKLSRLYSLKKKA